MNTDIAVGNEFKVEWRNFEPRLFFQGQISFETALDVTVFGTSENYEQIGKALVEALNAQREEWFELGMIDKVSQNDLFRGTDLF